LQVLFGILFCLVEVVFGIVDLIRCASGDSFVEGSFRVLQGGVVG
jgi:hypothetical protein